MHTVANARDAAEERRGDYVCVLILLYMCPHAGDQYGRAGILGAIFEKSTPPEPNLPNLKKTLIDLIQLI